MALGPTPYPNLQTLSAPTTRQVDANSTVQGQLSNIMNSGNPILERAKTRAAQAANKRGLLNTSMGVQAGQEAMLTAATPLAQQDAATYNNQGLTNQTVQNQFSRDTNEYVRQRGLSDQGFRNTYNLSDQGFNQQTGGGTYGSGLIGAELAGKKELLASEQAYGAGQSSLDRGFSSSEAQLGREQQQNLLASEQSFGAGQSALGRGFSSSESQLGREQQQNLLASEQSFGAGQSQLGRDFSSSESQLGREQQSGLLASEQSFGAGQSQLGRDFSSSEAQLGREQQSGLLASEQAFGAGQSQLGRDFSSSEAQLGREQQQNLLASEQAFGSGQSQLGRDFSSSESQLGREQQSGLLASEQAFGSGQSQLGRDFSSSEAQLGREQQQNLLASEQSFGESQSALGREQQSGLQQAQQDFAASETALGREQQTGVQKSDQDFSSTQAALGREQQSELQQGQQDFSASESELGRAQQLAAINQTHTNAVASAKTAQENVQANLTMQNGLQKQLVNLGHTNDLGLTNLKADLDTGKLSQEVFANTQGAYLQSVSELVRQTQITVGEIQMKEGISSEDKTKMLADQGILLTAHLAAQKTMYSSSATWKQDWATLPSAE